jgi:hypothetical protein
MRAGTEKKWKAKEEVVGGGRWRLPRKRTEHSQCHKAGGWTRGMEEICWRVAVACKCFAEAISPVSQGKLLRHEERKNNPQLYYTKEMETHSGLRVYGTNI